ISMLDTGASAGPLSNVAVSLTVPATVPVNSFNWEVNTAAAVFDGTVKVAVRDPLENWVAGSSLAISAFGVNVNLSVPARALGWSDARFMYTSKPPRVLNVAGRPASDRAGTGGSTTTVNCFVL